MTDLESDWQMLAGKLRRELHQYGALLKMLDDQRRLLVTRDSEGIVEMNGRLADQCHELSMLRSDREKFAAGIGGRYGLSASVTVKELTACFPPESRPLVEALLVEVNRLIDQTKRRLDQNQRLFNRAQEMEQRLLSALQPVEAGTTYTSGGSKRPGISRPVNYNRHA